jgi:hypothetical protein
MSFFEDASLVLIPSAQKTSKVYSVKPTDGTGDLTFTRSNDTATRVGPDGLIEKVRTNIILQSETFDNASWTKYQTSATGNSTTAPNGTTTADTLTENTVNDIHVAFQSNTVVAGELTVSCYAKANTKNHAWLQIYDGSTFQNSGIFNLTAGTVSGAGTITNEGNGWYRISFTATVVAGSTTSYIGLSDGTNVSYTGTSQSIFIWGYQTEQGVKTDYIATTTAAVSVGPVANVPRLDYLGSSCGRLILEGQRTNLVFYSEQLNNAGWAGSAVVTANTAVSPDGFTNADSVMDSATTDYQIIGDPVATTNGTAYTFSFFAKPNGRNFARVLFGNGSFPDNQSAYFNLLTGATSASAYATASMVSYGNGWYRCIATCTSDANATDSVYFGPARNMTDGYLPYVGNVSLGIYAWGAQQEAGAYATSYIPTLGSASTRAADAASKTGISSLIGQTEGTLFVDFNWEQKDGVFMINSISDGTTSNELFMAFGSSGNNLIRFSMNAGGINYVSTDSGVISSGRHKIAVAYKTNDVTAYIDGVQIFTDTSAIVPATSAFKFARSNDTLKFVGSINQQLLFPTRLSNSDLAALTA